MNLSIMKTLKRYNKANINIYIISLICIFLIAVNLSSCVGMSQEERDKELIDKVLIPVILFENPKDSEEVLNGMSKEEREKFLRDLQDAVHKYYEENKDFKVKDTVLKVLDDYDIDENQLDKFKIHLNSYTILDEKKYGIKYHGISMDYNVEKNETYQDCFPGKTDEEIDEIIKKIMEYANETAKKGEEAKLSPEVMDELGIDSYNKDKLDKFIFQYSYTRDIE